ncbi:MAG: gliding motility-associated C-terminal domain-containing protein [Saprospiraceae bacterium]
MGRSVNQSKSTGILATISLLCLSGIFLSLQTLPIFEVAVEICNNAKDDDADGLIDLNDPDCECQVVEPISLIPNPSFEERSCCPSERAQLNCSDVWIQASDPTTDYLHECGWMGWEDLPPPLPFPDGKGVVGFRDGRVVQNGADRNWKEYAGACLLSPLRAGTTYRFEFFIGFVNSERSPAINVTFFGTTDCKNLPFGKGNAEFGCPTNGPNWVRLGSTFVTGQSRGSWEKVYIDVTPTQDIYAMAIGPDCDPVLVNVSTYYFFDNLVLADIRSFEFKVDKISHPCKDDFLLKVPFYKEYNYQWYKDGIALVGEDQAQLKKMHGEGKYQTLIDDGSSCKVTTFYDFTIPVLTTTVNKTICKDDVLVFGKQRLSKNGTYIETFKSVDNCDSIVTMNLKVLGELFDTVSARIFEGHEYKIQKKSFKNEGDHLVNLKSVIGCDSLVYLHLDYYKLFAPNIFSPNGDGFNDLFYISGSEEYIAEIELSIFDRWGSLIYKGKQWDGSNKGLPAISGVYIYVATIIMNDGAKNAISGSITAIK